MSSFIKNLTDEEIKARHERNNELAKLRQRKYYEKNKEKILLKKKETAKELRETYKEIIKNQKDEEPEIIIQEPIKTTNTTSKKLTKSVLDEETTINKLEMLDTFKSESSRSTYITNTKALFRITGCKDLLKCLKSYNKIINYIKNSDTLQGDDYSINSKKTLIQTVVYLIDNLEIEISKTIKQKYNDYFDLLKVLSHEQAKKNKISKFCHLVNI